MKIILSKTNLTNNLRKLVEVGKHLTKFIKFVNNFTKFIEFTNNFMKFMGLTNKLTSGEWGCPLDNGPKLATGQPNST